MPKKLTEAKLNTMLNKVWKSGFALPSRYHAPKDLLLEILLKMDSYKYKKNKIKYQRKIFGIADGDLISLKSIIYLIHRCLQIKKGA